MTPQDRTQLVPVVQHLWRFHQFRIDEDHRLLVYQHGDPKTPGRWVGAVKTIQDATALILGNEASLRKARQVRYQIRVRELSGGRTAYPVD